MPKTPSEHHTAAARQKASRSAEDILKSLKPSVLQLIHKFIQGGSERQMIQLTRLLKESGRYRVHVACLRLDGVLRGEVERLGVGDIPEYPLTNFYNRNMVVQLRRCANFLREHRIDVVHTHDFYTNIFGMAAAALARVPVRIASRRETGGIRTAAQKTTERYAYRFAHAIVTNAEAVREQLIKEGVSAKKIMTVYNGMDMERIAPRPGLRHRDVLAELNLPFEKRRRFVTIVANMRLDVKDHPTFLRAARRVRAEVPEAAFVIAGDGELESSLRALAAQLGLERDVFFIGRCARVGDLLAVSDVCVLSSKAEGFSNSILEYMTAARPVVVTDVGGAREAVADGETGYLVSAGDDEMMGARIISLLRDPETARAMGELGRRIIEQKFSCEAQLENTHSLYNSLLARSGATRLRSVESLGRKSV